jgi:hypothetical protein
MYRHVYTGYNQCTNKYIQIKTHSSWYIPCIYKNNWFCNVVLCTCCLRTCSSNVWTRYIHQMYKLTCVCTYFMNAKSWQHQESNPWSLAWNPAILTPWLAALMQVCTNFVYIFTLDLEVGDVRLAPDQPPPQPPPSRRRPEPRHGSP